MKEAEYLILPPDHLGDAPDGYIALPSPTYQSYALLRSNYRSAADVDIADAVAYGKRVRVYPLSAADDPPPTTFIDAIDVLFDATIPYDARFFDALNSIVQTEPWLIRDKSMIDAAEDDRHRKGKTVRPERQDATDLHSRCARGIHVAAEQVGRRRISRRPISTAAIGMCPPPAR